VANEERSTKVFNSSFQAHQPRVFGNWFVAYEIFVILWFFSGIGYLVMIMGFLVR
jgi:hypothetical protein